MINNNYILDSYKYLHMLFKNKYKIRKVEKTYEISDKKEEKQDK